MIPQLPWWHRLLKPYFNWRADRKEKRAAKRKLNEFKRVGYMGWYNVTTRDTNGYVALLENGKGERRIKAYGTGRANDMSVQAWLDHDDAVAQHFILTHLPSRVNEKGEYKQ